MNLMKICGSFGICWIGMSGSDPLEERSLHQIHELQLSLDAQGKKLPGDVLKVGFIDIFIFIVTRI